MKFCIVALLSWWMFGPSASANTIRTSKACIPVGEDIIASFTVTSPMVGDWVGITNSSSVLSAGGVFYQNFLYTCGTSSCIGARSSGTLSFFHTLPVGTYKAVLLTNNTFTAVAVSPTFSISPSCQPTSPTRPVANSVPKPSTVPVRPPTPKPTNDLSTARQALQQASAQITDLVRNDRLLLQQFLRLLFHDCHGICDGCVDMANRDNGLLDVPINLLAPIVRQFATPQTGISRADIWVLAMNIALNHVNQQPTRNPVNFEMKWIGRTDCEKRNPNAVCTDAEGRTIRCGALSGPKRTISPVNMDSLEFANFWRNNFKDVSMRHAIALMGCHTVGRSFKQVSGIHGPDGWVIDNVSFNNEYFQALLGSAATPNMTLPELLSVAPKWVHAVETNDDNGLPTRHFWTLKAGGKRLIMLHGDVAFVRHLDSSNMNGATGQVGCTFTKEKKGQLPVCPAANTIQIAAEFLDNDVWLRTVKEGLELMTTNGYTRGPCPAGQLCRLSP